MEFIDFEKLSGEANMQKDCSLLEIAISEQKQDAIFRLYGWEPACISLGRNQNDSFVNKDLLSELGIDCVRRLSGGRALLHDKEITYSYIAPVSLIAGGDNIAKSYRYISSVLIEIFKIFDIELTIGGAERHITKNNYCMSISTGADLCLSGKKFIGSAQYRKNGYILQHGSILLDYDPILTEKIFNEKTDFSSIVSLKQINPDITADDIIQAAKQYFEKL
ncbi:MAG: lipoate--protein ligase family protein [Candidatus Gastranaerophilales bacterium]|nr:lipoate--protein ligase family protein [Candidatus Gastranaerophilales bacterium]